MSRWIRGIYNAAANFNMSNALRATSVGRVGRDEQHLSESSDEPNQYVEPCKSSESDKSCNCPGTCPCTGTTGSTTRSSATTPCPCTGTCPSSSGDNVDTIIIGNDVVITVNRECNTAADYIEREYAEYTATIRAQREGNSSGVWVSDEPRDFKHSNNATGTNVEHITGIPTGVTI